jgi:spore coat polysaccharide biosynthesis protein SpsF
MKPKFLITIEARVNSSRLPNKVMKNLGRNINALKLIIERIRIFKLNHKVIIVTSRDKSNNAIENLANKMNVFCYRGSEKNVLRRLFLGVKNFPENSIIQLTADNPFIDIKMIKFMIKYYTKFYPKLDFVTNNNLFNKTHSSPIGIKASIIKKDSLKKVFSLAKKNDLKEHPTLYFYREGKKKFKVKNLMMPEKWRIKLNPRLTLDTKEDFVLLKNIFRKLNYKINFVTADIKKILLKNPRLLNINKSIKQKIPKNLLN